MLFQYVGSQIISYFAECEQSVTLHVKSVKWTRAWGLGIILHFKNTAL